MQLLWSILKRNRLRTVMQWEINSENGLPSCTFISADLEDCITSFGSWNYVILYGDYFSWLRSSSGSSVLSSSSSAAKVPCRTCFHSLMPAVRRLHLLQVGMINSFPFIFSSSVLIVTWTASSILATFFASFLQSSKLHKGGRMLFSVHFFQDVIHGSERVLLLIFLTFVFPLISYTLSWAKLLALKDMRELL